MGSCFCTWKRCRGIGCRDAQGICGPIPGGGCFPERVCCKDGYQDFCGCYGDTPTNGGVDCADELVRLNFGPCAGLNRTYECIDLQCAVRPCINCCSASPYVNAPASTVFGQCYEDPPHGGLTFIPERERSTYDICCHSISSDQCRGVGCCCPDGSCRNIGYYREGVCPRVFSDCNIDAGTGCANRGRTCVTGDDNCGTGCCLCNRCCDMPASECTSKGGTVTGSCSDANVRTSCRVSNVKPPCRKGEWKVGKRPSPHFSGMTIGAAANRMAIFSNAPQRTIDRAPGTEECRVSYAHIEKHPDRSYAGAGLCNTYNRNCTQPTQSGRVRQRMKLVKSATKNAMVWEGRYRPPCPESADFGCTQTVGCP